MSLGGVGCGEVLDYIDGVPDERTRGERGGQDQERIGRAHV